MTNHRTPWNQQPTAMFTTAANVETDWLDDVVTPRHEASNITAQASREADAWLGTKSATIINDKPELSTQASGYADLWAGQYGLQAGVAKQAFMARLVRTADVEDTGDEYTEFFEEDRAARIRYDHVEDGDGGDTTKSGSRKTAGGYAPGEVGQFGQFDDGQYFAIGASEIDNNTFYLTSDSVEDLLDQLSDQGIDEYQLDHVEINIHSMKSASKTANYYDGTNWDTGELLVTLMNDYSLYGMFFDTESGGDVPFQSNMTGEDVRYQFEDLGGIPSSINVDPEQIDWDIVAREINEVGDEHLRYASSRKNALGTPEDARARDQDEGTNDEYMAAQAGDFVPQTQAFNAGEWTTASRRTAGRYLVIDSESDSVVVENNNLAEAVREAAELGYTDGYVSNQDGGKGDLAELIGKYASRRTAERNTGLKVGDSMTIDNAGALGLGSWGNGMRVMISNQTDDQWAITRSNPDGTAENSGNGWWVDKGLLEQYASNVLGAPWHGRADKGEDFGLLYESALSTAGVSDAEWEQIVQDGRDRAERYKNPGRHPQITNPQQSFTLNEYSDTYGEYNDNWIGLFTDDALDAMERDWSAPGASGIQPNLPGYDTEMTRIIQDERNRRRTSSRRTASALDEMKVEYREYNRGFNNGVYDTYQLAGGRYIHHFNGPGVNRERVVVYDSPEGIGSAVETIYMDESSESLEDIVKDRLGYGAGPEYWETGPGRHQSSRRHADQGPGPDVNSQAGDGESNLPMVDVTGAPENFDQMWLDGDSEQEDIEQDNPNSTKATPLSERISDAYRAEIFDGVERMGQRNARTVAQIKGRTANRNRYMDDLPDGAEALIKEVASHLGDVGYDFEVLVDWGDPWGTAMGYAFAINDLISDGGGQTNDTFSQGIGGSDTDSYEYQAMAEAGLSVSQLEAADRAMDRLLDVLKDAGRDY